MAGPAVSLKAAALRSSGLELLGSGFGSASLQEILAGVSALFKSAVETPFDFAVKTAPLSEVEASWNSPEQGVRLVFQP